MKSPHLHRSSCILCSGENMVNALPLRASAVADAFVPKEQLAQEQPAYPMDVYLCRDCGNVQLLDILDPEMLFGNYIYETSISLSLKEHFQAYANELSALSPPKPGSLALDIGSNDGTLLGFLKEKDFRVLGVDPARDIAARATAKGIETLPTFFNSKIAADIRVSHGVATSITANNVFAHSDQLGDMAEGIRSLLAPEGIFVFEVSYLLDMVRNMVFDWVYHEHLCYHSILPLTRFFQKHGLELIDVRRVGTKGGSIRCFVQLQGGPRPVAPVIGEMLQEEEKVGLHTPEFFQDFYHRIEKEKQALLQVLQEAKTKGLTIAGYGASATTTTLIYHFELGPLLDFIVDDDRLRHYRFSPGHHLEVFPSDALYEKRPDLVVLLAWRYAEPIMKRHRAYLESGGRFLLPLPEFKEIADARVV